MDSIFLYAHAKINLTLDVLYKRPDNYHEIRSIMQSIGIADRLKLKKIDKGIDLKTNGKIRATRDNLAYTAAEKFFQASGLIGGVEIFLEKNIPIAAGLAGGSADAAAVLYGLNQLYDEIFSVEQLQVLGGSFGADIPFCLVGGTMLAEGIGEKLTKLPSIPELSIVLIQIDYFVPTKEVYQSLTKELFGDKYSNRMITVLEKLSDSSDIQLARCMGNALEDVTIQKCPEITQWKKRLLAHGALGALMSGSGPTVYGLFDRLEDAQDFYRHWADEGNIIITKPSTSGVSLVQNWEGTDES
ncbi:MAG: 4-(cytidine 5'-diphospho)-2-C-methyl-D-erythritol kinase [Firmicutes bacterium]|nr:4-(cytidine 5'-diphospho)-2-C-methyl-D-erythritol kinase [Bacillota bacterium]